MVINNYKSILLLGGDLPSARILSKLNWQVKVVAADSGLIGAIHNNLRVDCAIGDLDSINSSGLEIPDYIKVIKDLDQNTTDFEKAIGFLRSNKITPTLILGISGREIDHTINNIHSMVKHYQKNEELFFLDSIKDDNTKIGMVISGDLNLSCRPNSIVSIFPYPTANISATGLQYQLQQTYLEQCQGVLAARNITTGTELCLSVHQGKILLVMDLADSLLSNQPFTLIN
jgi:thiamine pyrophosphokinase